MKLQAAFLFLVGDADGNTCTVVSTPSIDLHVIGCRNYDDAVTTAKNCVAKGITAIELCAGFGNIGVARISEAVGADVAVGAVKFDFHQGLSFKSGDVFFN